MPSLEIQAQRYLNSERFKAEVAAALFGAWWGGWVLYKITLGLDPLAWFPGHRDLHLQMAAGILSLSLIHAGAVRANGRWGFVSPALRLFCLAGFTVFFGALSWASSSTGFATYFAIMVAFAYAGRAAFGDLKLAMKGHRYA